MHIMADMYVTEMVKVLEQSKNSTARVVLQAGIEKADEDPTTWDVEACQRILADLSRYLEVIKVDLPQDLSVNLVVIFKKQIYFDVGCIPF